MAKAHTQTCPVAAALNIVGDHWTLLIIREAFYGATRFKDFQTHTGIARNLLADRLALLVEAGVFRKVDIAEQGRRYAYHFTDKGLALKPVLLALFQWGNRYLYGPGKEPVLLHDSRTGERIDPLEMRCGDGQEIRNEFLEVRPGPGADAAAIQRLQSVEVPGLDLMLATDQAAGA